MDFLFGHNWPPEVLVESLVIFSNLFVCAYVIGQNIGLIWLNLLRAIRITIFPIMFYKITIIEHVLIPYNLLIFIFYLASS